SNFTRASVLAALDTVGDGGDFTIRNGRNFSTAGDFTVDATGALSIESGTTFEVPSGQILTNIDGGGAFTDGTFNVNGTLRAPTAVITTIRNTVVIRGAGSGIQDSGGADALSGLSLIDTTGSLTILDEASLNLSGPLTVLGTLVVGTPPLR